MAEATRGELDALHGVLGRMAEQVVALSQKQTEELSALREEVRVGFATMGATLDTVSASEERLERHVMANTRHIDKLRSDAEQRRGGVDVLLRWLPWALAVVGSAAAVWQAVNGAE